VTCILIEGFSICFCEIASVYGLKLSSKYLYTFIIALGSIGISCCLVILIDTIGVDNYELRKKSN